MKKEHSGIPTCINLNMSLCLTGIPEPKVSYTSAKVDCSSNIPVLSNSLRNIHSNTSKINNFNSICYNRNFDKIKLMHLENITWNMSTVHLKHHTSCKYFIQTVDMPMHDFFTALSPYTLCFKLDKMLFYSSAKWDLVISVFQQRQKSIFFTYIPIIFKLRTNNEQ